MKSGSMHLLGSRKGKNFKLLNIIYLMEVKPMINLVDIPAEMRWAIATKSATAMLWAYGTAFLYMVGKERFYEIARQILMEEKMKDIKSMLTVFVLASAMLTAIGASQDSWDLGSPGDWLSVGPVYHIGPYYYPNSDLSIGTQRFLNTYPSYTPFGYSNYYQNYNPYFYNPQAALDLAVANHAYQKSVTNY
jgi:hypothetical protein